MISHDGKTSKNQETPLARARNSHGILNCNPVIHSENYICKICHFVILFLPINVCTFFASWLGGMAKGKGLLSKPNQERGKITKPCYYTSRITSRKINVGNCSVMDYGCIYIYVFACNVRGPMVLHFLAARLSALLCSPVHTHVRPSSSVLLSLNS